MTIGIPFFNSQSTLIDAIRSIFAQTFQDWELILIDDGSTDTSLEIAQSIMDPRVSVYSDGANRGLAYRLNQVTDMAQGQFIVRMDSDDLMHPERLEKQLQFLSHEPDVDVVGTPVYIINNQNIVTGIRGEQKFDTRPQSVLKCGLYIHPSIMGHIEWFKSNPYDSSFTKSEDYELWCRTCPSSNFGLLPSPLLFYREEQVNLTNYRFSCQTHSLVLKKYGPPAIGKVRTSTLMMSTYLKSLIYQVHSLLGFQSFISFGRNRKLDESTVRDCTRIIDSILSTPVPGL